MRIPKRLPSSGYYLVIPALLSALLFACGGSAGDAAKTTAKSASAEAAIKTDTNAATPDSLQDAISADAKIAPKSFLLLGDADGFASVELAQSLSKGSESKYDVLVVGRNVALEASTQTAIEKALKEGKTVIVDGNPDGSSSQNATKALAAITGVSAESDAYMLEGVKESNGYLLTPIDSPKSHVAQQASLAKQAGDTGKSADITDQAKYNNTLSALLDLNGGK